jgi:hypothetical protein
MAVLALLALACGPAAAQDEDSAIQPGPAQKDEIVVEPVASVEAVNTRLEQLFGAWGPFADAFEAIQTAVGEGDAATLAQWVAYPFRVSYDDQELVVEDEDGFVEHYDEILTEDIAEAIAGQPYESLFVNSDGVMFGSGQMWMTMICEDDACSESAVKIIAIQSTLR